MKKLGLLLCSIILIILGLFFYINYNDGSYLDKIEKRITNNTDIEGIEYVNWYNNNYIVLDSKYLYLIDEKYDIVLKIDKSKIYKNSKNYDIIYSDNHFMYFNDEYKDDKIIYEYYDIYTYELIKKVMVGGNDGTSN